MVKPFVILTVLTLTPDFCLLLCLTKRKNTNGGARIIRRRRAGC